MGATTPAYPTRLSETQWATLAAYFAADSQLGRPRNTHLPAVVEAILYVLRAGSGACCRGSFRRGRLCMATSDPGATRAVGSPFTATYAGGTAPVKRPSRPGWPSPIRSRCRWAASPTGQEALTEVNGSKGTSAMCWWTAWACS